jgi:hypothetical protein
MEDSPQFLPDGDLVFRAIEDGSNYLYRMKKDGHDRRKITPDRVLDAVAVSPDGRWFAASIAGPDQEHQLATKAFPINGADAVTLCADYCLLGWDSTGKFMSMSMPRLFDGYYVMPVQPGVGLPRLPATGVARLEDLARTKIVAKLPRYVAAAASPSFYAFTRQNTRRNLYRIPLP